MHLQMTKLSFIWLAFLTLLLPSMVSQKYKAFSLQNQSQGVYREMVKAQSEARIIAKNEQYGQYFTSAHNKFSAYTHEQWKQMFLGGKTVDPDSIQVKHVETATFQQKSKLGIQSKPALFNAVIPTSFSIDYTTTNPPLVTSIKEQGSCGSCWAFAGIAQIQSYFLKKHNLHLDLSEQQMVDCVPTVVSSNSGCGGGSVASVGYYSTLRSIAQQKYYPYTASQQSCSQSRISNGRTFKIPTYSFIHNCVTLINTLLNYKPIAVCGGVDNNWMSYKSGVLPFCNQDRTGGHCFLLVGAVSDGTSNILTNWYKYKNSWGTDWGENGFIRIYRDAKDTTVGPCASCTAKWGSMYTL